MTKRTRIAKWEHPSLHRSDNLGARKREHNGAHWVTVFDRNDEESELLTLFYDDPQIAEAFVFAINNVRELALGTKVILNVIPDDLVFHKKEIS